MYLQKYLLHLIRLSAFTFRLRIFSMGGQPSARRIFTYCVRYCGGNFNPPPLKIPLTDPDLATVECRLLTFLIMIRNELVMFSTIARKSCFDFP